MNNDTMRYYAGQGVARMAAIFVFVTIIAVTVSLFFSADPTQKSSFDLFVVFCYGPWLVMMSVMALVLLTAQNWCVWPRLSRLMLPLCGLMMWRVWGHIDYFPEVWGLTAIFAVIAIEQGLLVASLPKVESQGQMIEASPGNEKSEGAAERITEVKRPSVRFADVAGMQELKDRLLPAAQEVLDAHKSGKKARNGILLTGKPGNGKTLMAEALAGELGLPFIPVTFGEVVSKWIGDTPQRVARVFKEAKAHAPCLLFLDEVDSLMASRNGNSTNEESAKIVNILLTELVNIRGSGVVVVAATNFVDRLDPAAIREGRFDFKIEIPAPDAPARAFLIGSKAKGRIDQITLDTAVRRWEGFSVARIAAIMEEVTRMPGAQRAITFDMLRTALRTIQGRRGNIPEGTPVLSQMVMPAELSQRLVGLADRMDRIVEIEAMGGSVPRGVLFHGPAGTGKTLMARALAKTAGWAFLSASGIDLMAKPDAIETLVDEASDLRPCVVFIDEADDVFKDRRYSNNATVTNKLLAVIDGSGGHIPDVLFIAATNHPDDMDAAALRGGRFTEKIEFVLPDEQTIVSFIHSWASTSKAKLDLDVSVEDTAQVLAGNPIANLKEIMQMAVNNAISRLAPKDDVAIVNTADIRNAVKAVTGR